MLEFCGYPEGSRLPRRMFLLVRVLTPDLWKMHQKLQEGKR